MARVSGFEPGKSGQQPVLANGAPFAAVGVWGDSDIGVGVFGTTGALPEGTFIPIESSGAVTGHSAIREGVVGCSVNANGVLGVSHWAAAVVGRSDTTQGVQGLTSGTFGSYGVWGAADAPGGGGVFGISEDGNGVAGMTSADAQQDFNVAAVRGESANGLAGLFVGKVRVAGELSKSGGGFTIDHPKDPENQYLSHSFVEAPDRLNVYSGNVTTDDDGNARVALPSYFEDLNTDFRYQLTVIGDFAAAVVAEEVKDNEFAIRTDRGQVKVSWQVTGVRQDAWAKANRIEPEQQKVNQERGKYLHPELFGKKAIGLHPVGPR